jgi:bis(5'-nucleosyl)-tetraphosphatase (symmetrical)
VHWVVGDLHGCAEPLERLLTEIRFDARRDTLWCTGDLVNTGPEPVETLRILAAVGARSVLGNHDVYAVRAARGWIERRPDGLDALFADPDRDRWIDWLASLPLFARLPSPARGPGTIVVHAGFHPGWDDPAARLEAVEAAPRNEEWFSLPEVAFATRVRCCTRGGDRSSETGPPSACRPPFRPWDAWWKGPERVVHGHWARRGHYRLGHALGVDSGCVYGGPLTAWSLEEDRVVQVPGQARRMYS